MLLVLCTLFTVVFTGMVASAAGSEENYSNVIDDLKKDASFAVSDHPVNDSDYRLNVIQIAEGSNKELFVYVHNPSYRTSGLIASDIVMWDDASITNFTPRMYSLKLISTFEQYDKYLVEGYTVSSEVDRYYNFSEILVPYDASKADTVFAGKDIINGDINKVAYEVGQQWHANWFNGVLTYERADLDTVELRVTYPGEIMLRDGITWCVGQTGVYYAHFVVFDCDEYIIKHIYDGYMTYKTETVRIENFGGRETEYRGTPVDHDVTLTDKDTATFNGKGLFAQDIIWSRIMSATDFKNTLTEQNVTLSADLTNALSPGSWVFAFYESPYTVNATDTKIITTSTHVFEVGILRLHFADLTGKEYNLGVVSNITTSDGVADGVGGGVDLDFSSLEELLKIILLLLGVFVLVACFSFISPILGAFVNILVKGFTFIIRGIANIIALPFRLIFRGSRR